MSRTGWVLLALVGSPPMAVAQPVGTWTAHTSMRQVVDLAASESFVWAATTGGIFSYAPATGELRPYTAADGLYDVQTHAIAWDARRQRVWVGYGDGVLDRLDVQTGAVRTFFDLFRSERFPSKTINRMVTLGDSLLVATDFGVVVFDLVREEVRDTYSQYGSIAAATPVNDLIVAPVPGAAHGLWLGTDAGVAYGALHGPSLQDPASWTVEQAVQPTRRVTAIQYLDNRLFVGTEFGLGRREDHQRYVRLDVTTREVRSLSTQRGSLLVATPFAMAAVTPTGSQTVLASGYLDLQAIMATDDSEIWLGGALAGLNRFRRGAGTTADLVTPEVYPEGPFDSQFGDLDVDGSGNLWAAAAVGVPGTGFYRMETSGDWTSYIPRFFDELRGRGSFWRVHADANGDAWAASRGSGLAQVTPDAEITVFDASNSTILPAAGTTGYYIIGGAASDTDGNLWITNTIAARPVHVRHAGGEWVGLPPPICDGAPLTSALGPILVDSNGLKWIVLLEQGNLNLTRGLLVLDTQDTPANASDDQCQFYNEPGAVGVGLPGPQILAFTEDLSGRIWVGTSSGPAYLQGSQFAATDTGLRAVWPVWSDRDLGSYVLTGLPVNDIAVDPSNRLWMATPEGVYVIEEQDGFELVAHFQAADSPLFSDEVTTIAVDGGSGRVFMGTDRGLISYQGDAISPAESTRDLFIYPNPVVIAEGDPPAIYIEGLVQETEISILAVHGALVRRMSARGGRARWDGRDAEGKLVPSGMYLVVAADQNSSEVAYGKVAVVR